MRHCYGGCIIFAAAVCLSLPATLCVAAEPEPEHEFISIPAGEYLPFYQYTETETSMVVEAFEIQKYAVTNRQFADFVAQHPRWARNQVARIVADQHYLQHWEHDSRPGASVEDNAPLVNVSWFAARAYCKSIDAQLPTEAQWEYAAQASFDQPNGRQDPKWQAQLVQWYSRPSFQSLPQVGHYPPNYFGLYDLHGVIWEWVEDYGATLLSNDSRQSANPDKIQFCGAGSSFAQDKNDYPSFMRFAMRMSLDTGAYAVPNLGFRCVREPDTSTQRSTQ